MQAKIVNGQIYKIINGVDVKPATELEQLGIHYKIKVAHMDLYCTACAEPPFSTEIEEGKVYTISDKNLILA